MLRSFYFFLENFPKKASKTVNEISYRETFTAYGVCADALPDAGNDVFNTLSITINFITPILWIKSVENVADRDTENELKIYSLQFNVR